MAREVNFIHRISPEDRYRHWHISEKGKILRFAVQFETTIENVWVPVVRYDTAHGCVHRDLMRPGQRQKKNLIRIEDYNAALTNAEEDIRKNWVKYKKAFIKERKNYEGRNG